MREILDLQISSKKVRLYGFQENMWEETSLANNTIFIDVDTKIYYSDIVSTFMWKGIQKELFLWNIQNFDIKNIQDESFGKQKKAISKLEESIYNKVKWQKQLHKLMDYFSKYLNIKNAE
jgi:hypothetical protein